MTADSTTDINGPESWKNAKAYAAKLGLVPSSFSSNIRMLLLDHEKNEGEATYKTRFQVSRLMNGPSMKSMTYYATRLFRPQVLEQHAYAPMAEIVKAYPAREVAGLIGIIFLYRKCRKGVPDEHWGDISEKIQIYTNLGNALGRAIPSIGSLAGMLVGGMPIIAMSTFLLHDSKGYTVYQRHLEKTKTLFDLEFECARWGCSSIQIASVLMQSLAYGVEFSESYVSGLDPRISDEEVESDPVYRIKIARMWIDSLNETGKDPEMTHRGKYYPLTEDLERLKEQARKIRIGGQECDWLSKTKDDVSPELTPHLFRPEKSAAAPSPAAAEEEAEAPAADSAKADLIEKLPKEVFDLYSREELEEMSDDQLSALKQEALSTQA